MEYWIYDRHKRLVAKRVNQNVLFLDERNRLKHEIKIRIIGTECYKVIGQGEHRPIVAYPCIGKLAPMTILDRNNKPVAFIIGVPNKRTPRPSVLDTIHKEIEQFYGYWSNTSFFKWVEHTG